MLFAARIPIRVGIVPWLGRLGVSTVVVKQTYDVVSRGTARLSARPKPLNLDILGHGDVVLYPTDFSPAKGLCDVVVVGAALLDPVGPARLAVGEIRKLVELPRDLGPRPGVGVWGDPTNPGTHEEWGDASFDFQLFQCAPRDQRRPCTSLPLDIVYELGPTRVVTRLEGPEPAALLVDRTGWTAPKFIALRADTILIDPDDGCISVLFRGVVDVADDCEPLLVVEAQAPLRSFTPREMERWPQAEAVDPRLLRRLQALAPVADGSPELDPEEALGTTARLEVPRGAAPETSSRHPPARLAADDATPDDEAPATTPTLATAPKLSAPHTAPSFGAPPPLLRPTEAAVVPPVAPLPKARLGGLMMLPLETRTASTPPSSPPGEWSASKATEHSAGESPLAESSDDDLLTGTMQAMAPAELRRPALLPFAKGIPGAGASRTPSAPAALPRVTATGASSSELPAARPDAGEPRGFRDATLLLQIPAELRGEALPFDRAATTSDAQAPTDRPPPLLRAGVIALPPPPPAPRGTLIEGDGDDLELGVGTLSIEVPAELRALPFVAPAGAPPATSTAPSTSARSGLPFGSRTGTFTNEADKNSTATEPPDRPRARDTLPPVSDPRVAAGLSALRDTVPLPIRPHEPLRHAPSAVSPAPAEMASPPFARPAMGRFSTGDTAPPPPLVASVDLPTEGDAVGSATPSGGPRMLSRDEFAEIRAALWANTGGRRELLAKRGFSELSWRLAERRFMKNLVHQPEPDRILAMVSRLQDQVRRNAVATDGGPPTID